MKRPALLLAATLLALALPAAAAEAPAPAALEGAIFCPQRAAIAPPAAEALPRIGGPTAAGFCSITIDCHDGSTRSCSANGDNVDCSGSDSYCAGGIVGSVTCKVNNVVVSASSCPSCPVCARSCQPCSIAQQDPCGVYVCQANACGRVAAFVLIP
jgi:hypothetical protein